MAAARRAGPHAAHGAAVRGRRLLAGMASGEGPWDSMAVDGRIIPYQYTRARAGSPALGWQEPNNHWTTGRDLPGRGRGRDSDAPRHSASWSAGYGGRGKRLWRQTASGVPVVAR